MEMGRCSFMRLAKSSRSSIRATVYFEQSVTQSRPVSLPSQRLLKSTTVFLRIENLEDLFLVRFRVRGNLFGRQRRARYVAAGRVADHAR